MTAELKAVCPWYRLVTVMEEGMRKSKKKLTNTQSLSSKSWESTWYHSPFAISSIHGDGIAEPGQETVDTLICGVGNLALLEGTSHVPLFASALQNAIGDNYRV